MNVFFSFLIIVVYFIVLYFAAKVFEEIAEMKGHKGSRFFWWCFWVGPVGMMMVIALPDRRINAGTPIFDDLPDLKGGEGK